MWTVIPNPTLRSTQRMPWYQRLWWRFRYLTAAPMARISLMDERAQTITTHPDNVAPVCDFLRTNGHKYRVGAPVLRAVAGGK